MISAKMLHQLKSSIDMDVRIFTCYGTSYRGTIKDVTDGDVELVDVKVCDTRAITPGTFYYPRKAIVLLSEITVVEGGFFEEEEDMSWLEKG